MKKEQIRPLVHLSHAFCFNVFNSSLVSNKSARREQQNVVCASVSQLDDEPELK